MIYYKTIMGEGYSEQIIEKSKFLCHTKPVESKEEADDFFSNLRKKYKDATHNVPAFICGDKMQIQWASDDGEPQGTAGAPIVQMLAKEEITNLALVVTRYFGGIKLGTGGLVRAYTSTAKLAVENAMPCAVTEQLILKIQVEYTHLGRLKNQSQEGLYQIVKEEFLDKVILSITCDPIKRQNFQDLISDFTSGNFLILSEDSELVKKTL